VTHALARARAQARTDTIYRDPWLWTLGGAVLLLFLVPSSRLAVLPLIAVGIVGLRRPALVVAVIPVSFPFYDAVSPVTHLRLDRSALLVTVALIATAGHVLLAIAPTFAPGITRFATAIVGETWTHAEVRALPDDARAFLRRPGTWAAVALLALGALSLFTLADVAHRGDSIRQFRTTILYPIAFFLLAAAVFEGARTRAIAPILLLLAVDALVLSGMIIACIGFWQFARGVGLGVEGVRRVRSIFHHPNEVALYLGRIVPVTAAYVLFGPKDTRRTLYLASTVVMLGAIGLSFSRGGYVAVAAALLVVLIAARNRTWVWGYLAVLFVGLLAALASGRERFTSLLSPGTGSEELRIAIWHSAAQMIRDHPIWGVGLDQFVTQYAPRYVDPAGWYERFTSHPHNIVLDFYVRLGLLGLWWLVFTLPPMLLRGWRAAMRLRNNATETTNAGAGNVQFALTLGAVGALVDFTIHGFVDQGYFLHMLAFGFWFAVLVIRLGYNTAFGLPQPTVSALDSSPRAARSVPATAALRKQARNAP